MKYRTFHGWGPPSVDSVRYSKGTTVVQHDWHMVTASVTLVSDLALADIVEDALRNLSEAPV
jgi:hypothetical protein